MKLSEIEDMWAVDCVIDKDRLDEHSIEKDQLVFKYHKILSRERIAYRAMGEKKKNLIKQLEDYYEGKIDGKDIGREPWQLTETKSAIEKRVENDEELIKFNLKMFEQEEKVLLLKSIIENLNNRSFGIGNAIKFMAFMKGAQLI